MRKLLFALSGVGLVACCALAYLSAITQPPLPPAFKPATNPYPNGIYANGILESDQASGVNINIYPEVPGTVKHISVSEGQPVKRGAILLQLDDSIQTATVAQLQSQGEAALSLLKELKAQPREETLAISEAQVTAAEASRKTAHDELEKQQAAFNLDPKSISRDALDTAANAFASAAANLEVARRQRDLTKAGAWIYDIYSQERQYTALHNSSLSAQAAFQIYASGAQRWRRPGREPHGGDIHLTTRHIRFLFTRDGSRSRSGKSAHAAERSLLRG